MKKPITIVSNAWCCAITLLLIASCANHEEPQFVENIQTPSTRSDNSSTPRTLSYEEVISSSSKVMNKTRSAINATLKPILACNDEYKDIFISDTIAYVVNYQDNGGYAIVPNDSRIDEILAYSNNHNFTENNVLANHFFVERIEGYLASVLSAEEADDNSNAIDKAPIKHFVINPQITVELGPLPPFNSVVEKYHPDCHAGFSNVAAATIISYFTDELVYNNFLYNFPALIYALNNHSDGYIPFINFPNPTFPGPILFYPSYEGAVSAFSQLIYDIGVASLTTYKPEGTKNPALFVMMTINNMGYDTTTVKRDNDIAEICQLLSDGYLINMFGTPKDKNGNSIDIPLLNGEVSWIIDGCDVMLNQGNIPVSGMVHVVWGGFGLGDDFYSYPVLLQDDKYILEQRGYYGVRANSDNQ